MLSTKKTKLMKKSSFTFVLVTLVASMLFGQADGDVYMFSYFKDNGQDGLHLAYSFDGYSWTPLHGDSSFLTPTAGKDKLMRDPCIIRGGDGLFHMVWTVSWNERGIGYASSKDLLAWSTQLYVPVMDNEPTTRNCWAPEIYFDKKRSQYIIYWASTIPGRFPQPDSSAESNYNHRLYYTTTKDFKSFRKTKLLYDPGFNVIDATIINDGKRFVMVLKDERRHPEKKILRLAYAKKPSGKFSAAGEPFTESWVEGPTVSRVKGAWVVYYDQYTRHKMGAVASSDLTVWRNISNELQFPPGARHGTVFTISAAEFENLK
jgi:hypothetical protein